MDIYLFKTSFLTCQGILLIFCSIKIASLRKDFLVKLRLHRISRLALLGHLSLPLIYYSKLPFDNIRAIF